MSRVLLLAMLDTMLPGDAGEPPLPAASQAALDLGKLERWRSRSSRRWPTATRS